jgi:hypothetical protein
MLEHACLIVHAWTRAEDGSAWIRRVTDAVGAPLGFARSKGAMGPWWLGWLRPLQLDVFETDDASHLMSLARSWALSRIWSVHDAEEIHVGTLYFKTLVSSVRTFVGEINAESTERGQIVDGKRTSLANYWMRPGGSCELTFAAATMQNPFMRMLILGSVLTLDPPP